MLFKATGAIFLYFIWTHEWTYIQHVHITHTKIYYVGLIPLCDICMSVWLAVTTVLLTTEVCLTSHIVSTESQIVGTYLIFYCSCYLFTREKYAVSDYLWWWIEIRWERQQLSACSRAHVHIKQHLTRLAFYPLPQIYPWI